ATDRAVCACAGKRDHQRHRRATVSSPDDPRARTSADRQNKRKTMNSEIRVNLNADMGEGFGAYDIGNDEAMLSIIGSASIACGKHAGDPNVMYRVVERAHQAGV